jgi:P27 family predicted phage terminase small subunit
VTSSTVALEPAIGVPPVPLDLEQLGRATWGVIWSSPARHWLSPQLDGPMRVHTVCRLADEIHDLGEIVQKLGAVLAEPLVTPAGHVVGERIVPNPAVKMLRDAEKQLDRELSALGFDPSSRARLGLAEVKTRNLLERLGGDDDADIIDIAADE